MEFLFNLFKSVEGFQMEIIKFHCSTKKNTFKMENHEK
jgi:hypothetical protein